MINYDESHQLAELSIADRAQKTAFAAACATTLFELVRRSPDAVGGDEELLQLQEAVDACWAATAEGESADLASAAEAAGSLVPDEDDADWAVDVGYAQNAAAAVEYACRTWVTDDAQQAVWAARQVYEAADLTAQQEMPEGQPYSRPAEADHLLSSPVVQEALAGIVADLEDVRRLAPAEWIELRNRAVQRGRMWAASGPAA